MILRYKVADKAYPCPICGTKQRAGVHFVNDGVSLVGDYMLALTFACSWCTFDMRNDYSIMRPDIRSYSGSLSENTIRRRVEHRLYVDRKQIATLETLAAAKDFLNGELGVVAIMFAKRKYYPSCWQETFNLVKYLHLGMT